MFPIAILVAFVVILISADEIGGVLVVFCGAVLWCYVLRIKRQYDSAPIDPSLMPIDLARSRAR